MNSASQPSKITEINTDELEQYFNILAAQIGPIPSYFEDGLSVGVEVFMLSEGLGLPPSSLQELWRHSIRTGFLAALIAIQQRVDASVAWEAFVGGLLHDIGMLIFLTQHSQVFMAVVDLAQCRGQELGTIEKNLLGTTHAESGAQFLARWRVPPELQTIVTFHDQPFQASCTGFCALTAVYIANVLEGGGMAQDCDGVIGWESEAYLVRLGLWDDLPSWQGLSRELFPLSVKWQY